MASRADYYQTLMSDSDRDPSMDLETAFQLLVADIDGRLVATETSANDFATVKSDVLAAVLTYCTTKLEPELQTIRDLADLGLMFEASSTTSNTVATGNLTFIVGAADRLRYTPPAYVGAFATDVPGVAVAGRKVSYDRASGTLVVDVDRTAGGGTAAAWTLSPVSPTDNLAAVPLVQASADAAASSATDAATARDTARDYRDAAQVARDAAQTFMAAAEAAAVATAANLAGINAAAQLYCGNGSDEPTTLPNGDPLVAGAEWYDPTAHVRKQWTGSSWDAVYVPSTSAVSSFNGRTGAVSPASGDYTATQISVSPSIDGGSTVRAVLLAHSTSIAAKADTSALSGYALVTHTHAVSDVTGLQAALDGKAALVHTHVISDVTGLQTALDGKSDTTHTHAAATTLADGFMSKTDKAKLDGVAAGATNYVHPSGDGNQHVPATGTTSNTKVLKAGSSAGSIAWGSVAFAELASVPTALSTIGGLTPAADRLAYYTSSSAAALATFTSIGRSVVGAANAAGVRSAISAADVSHTHVISDVSGLQTALDAKLSISAAAATYQPLASNLTTLAGWSSAYMTRAANLAALTGGGLLVLNSSGNAYQRSIAAGTGLSVTNGDGTSGNPTVSFSTTWGDARYAGLASLAGKQPLSSTLTRYAAGYGPLLTDLGLADDLNQDLESGWYMATPETLNTPASGAAVVFVGQRVWDLGRQQQLYLSAAGIWKRSGNRSGSVVTFGAWVEIATSSSIRALMASTSAAGAIGSTAWLAYATAPTSAVTAGTDVAGSSLRYAAGAGSKSGTPSGTWRLLGYIPANPTGGDAASLWERRS